MLESVSSDDDYFQYQGRSIKLNQTATQSEITKDGRTVSANFPVCKG